MLFLGSLGLPLTTPAGAAYRSPVSAGTAASNARTEAAALVAPPSDIATWAGGPKCDDTSVLKSVGDCCECMSEKCRAEGANGGACADSDHGVAKCCLDQKDVCYHEGLNNPSRGTCKDFYAVSSKNMTMYGYTEAEYDGPKAASLTRKLHAEMAQAALASANLAASEDECDTNMRKCRARGAKSLEECQGQHSSCKANLRAREQWQQKQDAKADAAEQANLRATEQWQQKQDAKADAASKAEDEKSLAKREAVKDVFSQVPRPPPPPPPPTGSPPHRPHAPSPLAPPPSHPHTPRPHHPHHLHPAHTTHPFHLTPAYLAPTSATSAARADDDRRLQVCARHVQGRRDGAARVGGAPG